MVDTGIHGLGWSRQQAIDYLVANTPQALNAIETEVERYIDVLGAETKLRPHPASIPEVGPQVLLARDGKILQYLPVVLTHLVPVEFSAFLP